MFARGSYENGLSPDFNGFGNAGSSIGSGPSGTLNTNIASNFIYTMNPTTILNVNLGYQRKDNFHTPFSQGTCPSALGLPAALDTVVQNCEFPQVTFGGNTNVSSLGQASFTSLKFIPYTYTAHADVTKVFAKHTVKAGYEFRKLFINFRQLGSPDGAFSLRCGLHSAVGQRRRECHAGQRLRDIPAGSARQLQPSVHLRCRVFQQLPRHLRAG